MKKLLTLLILAALMTSCTQVEKSQKDDNPMSGYMLGSDTYTERVQTFMKAYTDKNFEAAKDIFAEDAVFYVNDAKMNIEDMMVAFSSGHQYFDNIAHSNVYSATMYYNDGKIYTNVWYDWTGDDKSNGETLKVRGYAWFRWENGKVAEAYNAFDPTAYNAIISSQMNN